jgi:hypothetical protein
MWGSKVAAVIGVETEKDMSERKQNFGKAIELALRCKYFADETCHEWTEDTQSEGGDWRAASEMRELYFSLQVLRHSSEVVLQRASLLNNSL